MAIALHSARLAASFFLAKRRASSAFHRQIRDDIGSQIRLACAVQTASRWRGGQRALVEACRAYPDLARRFAGFRLAGDGVLENDVPAHGLLRGQVRCDRWFEAVRVYLVQWRRPGTRACPRSRRRRRSPWPCRR